MLALGRADLAEEQLAATRGMADSARLAAIVWRCGDDAPRVG